MQIFITVLLILVNLCIAVLWARLILDYVRLFAPSWRPRGVLLVLAEAVYTITDPPLKLLRRFIPPLRVGAVAIDVAWTVLLILLFIIQYGLGVLRFAIA